MVVALAIAPPAGADDFKPMCNAELVQNAYLIVVGVATEEGGKMSIRVSKVLKGQRTDSVALERAQPGGLGHAGIKAGSEGIFFLREGESGYALSEFGGYMGMDQAKAVQMAVDMAADPGPFLDLRKCPENVDVIHVLGERFGRWSISSNEVPNLQESWWGLKVFEEIPWDEKHLVTLQCVSDPKNGFKVSVTSVQPPGALGERVKYRLLLNDEWPVPRESLPLRFAVMFDARLPEAVGSATAERATSYLRDRLASANPEIAMAALMALAKMRDRDAVPRVLALLDHADRRVLLKAIEFLGWSRDPRAVRPLCSLLDAKAPQYPKDFDISNSAAEALGRIGAAEGRPHVERAACHGVYRAAEALGALGNAESFPTLLKAFQEDPRRCYEVDNALYWLVRRSNKNTEPWMHDEKGTRQALQIARIPRWTAWWRANQDGFKVVKSQREVVLERMQVGTAGP
jgi:hypothetical protein